MERENARSMYRVDIEGLRELCGCSTTTELVSVLKNAGNGQAFSSVEPEVMLSDRAKAKQLAWEAEALGKWFRKRKESGNDEEKNEGNLVTDVAVVSTASRPGPLDTQLRPKALLRIGDATLLTHCLRGLATAGIRHVVIVLGGPTANAISEHLSALRWSKYFSTLRLVDLGIHYTSGHAASLLAAGRLLLGPTQKPRPFLLVGVDHVYHHNILKRLLQKRSEQPAGLVLVEKNRRIIERLHLHSHSTAVRVAFQKEGPCDIIEAIGRDLDTYDAVEAGAMVLLPIVFDSLRQLARTAPYFTLSEALSRFTSSGGSPSPQLKAMSTNELPWIAVETAEQHVEAAVAQSPLLRFLPSRRTNRPGLGVKVVRGVALPVELKSRMEKAGIFDAIDDSLDEILAHPIIDELGTSPLKQLEMGNYVQEFDDQSEANRITTTFQKTRSIERKVSTGSLSLLLDAYEDLPLPSDTYGQPQSGPKAILSVDHDGAKAALGLFFEGGEEEQQGEETATDGDSDSVTSSTFSVRMNEDALELSLGGFSDSDQALTELAGQVADDTGAQVVLSENNRHLLVQTSQQTSMSSTVLPETDIEHVRLRLFDDDISTVPSLAIRLERRVPIIGYVLMIAGCLGCAATSALERELPSTVTGPLRSVWRQTLTTIMYILFELYRGAQSYNLRKKDYCIRPICRADCINKKKGKYIRVEESSPITVSSSLPNDDYNMKFCKYRANLLPNISSTMLGVDSGDDMTGVIASLVLGFAAQNMGLLIAFLFVSTPVALVLANSTPLWLVANGIICSESSTKNVVLLGVGIACIGAVILCAGEVGNENDQSSGSPFVGIVFGTIGGIGGACYVLAAKQAKAAAPTRLLLLCNLFSSFLSLLVVLVMNPNQSASLLNPYNGLLGWLAPSNIIHCICISIVVDGIGTPGILLALRYVNPIVVTVCLQLEPFLASCLDFLLGENTLASMTIFSYIGTSMLLLGCGFIAIFTATSKEDVDVSATIKPLTHDPNSCKEENSSGKSHDNGYGAFRYASTPPLYGNA